MILADKIIFQRKKAGWSQEELAEQLGVTRQSVSKWEGAQSVPDMDKILQMSRIFNVSTDYLLKDDIEEPEISVDTSEPVCRRVSLAEAAEYLARRRAVAPRIALATLLCILAPVVLIFLGGISSMENARISENAAAGIGLCIMILFVAVGTAIFIYCAAGVKEFDFLEDQAFETEYGVTGMVNERKKSFRKTYMRLNIAGTVLCICSVLPLFFSICFEASDIVYVGAVCLLLMIAGMGCDMFILGGTYEAALDRLLEEGEFTREEKSRKGITGTVSVVYWLLVTAVFLCVMFIPSIGVKQKDTWIIWAVAGVLYGAVVTIARAIRRK